MKMNNQNIQSNTSQQKIEIQIGQQEEEKKRLEIEKEIYEKSLNSKTMKFIMKNIGEGKENVSYEMKSKEQELEKKVETILNPKKKNLYLMMATGLKSM